MGLPSSNGSPRHDFFVSGPVPPVQYMQAPGQPGMVYMMPQPQPYLQPLQPNLQLQQQAAQPNLQPLPQPQPQPQHYQGGYISSDLQEGSALPRAQYSASLATDPAPAYAAVAK